MQSYVCLGVVRERIQFVLAGDTYGSTWLGSCIPFRLSQTFAYQPPGMDYTLRNKQLKFY